jgi:hypothetical protein
MFQEDLKIKGVSMTSTELDTKKPVIAPAESKRTLASVPMTVTQTAPPKKISRIRKATPSSSVTATTRKRPATKPTVRNKASSKPAQQSGKVAPTKNPVHSKKLANKSPKHAKPTKIKMVHDSFSMPEGEYALLGQVKKACSIAGIKLKKSELIRIAIEQLSKMSNAKIAAAKSSLTELKPGRSKK